MTKEELAKHRSDLIQELSLVKKELEDISVKDQNVKGSYQGTTENIGSSMEDVAQEADTLNRNQAIVTELKQRYQDILEAIAKIDNGEYGKCAVCSTPIHPDRLKAMPVAAKCIDCAQKADLV